MSLTLITAVALTRPAALTPAQVVSEVYKRYYGASELQATVRYTLTAGEESVNVISAIQYRRPDKLYLRQSAQYQGGKNVTVIADGKTFTYEMPQAVATYPGQRAVESQNGQKVDQVYAVATASLVDKSPILDILVAKKEHLEYCKDQFATMMFQKEGGPEGDENYEIIGNWRQFKRMESSGKYRLVISPRFDLISYTTEETMEVPPKSQRYVKLRNHWEADVKVGSVKDEKLFTLPKN